MRRHSFEFNFWPSIADMILAAFMIFLILWFAEKLFVLNEFVTIKSGMATYEQKLNECHGITQEKAAEVEKLTQDYSAGLWQCTRELGRCKEERDQVKQERDQFRKERNYFQEEEKLCQAKLGEFRSDKPPIITLDEAAGYSFESGSAKLSPSFEELLSNKTSELQRIFQHYNVDVVEVIGHTDGQPILGRRSNLDEKLEQVVAGQSPVEILQYGSNADLGLMRALSVVLFLKQQPLPKTIKFRVYSAAQLILPEGNLATIGNRESNEKRRRIELRFTRLRE